MFFTTLKLLFLEVVGTLLFLVFLRTSRYLQTLKYLESLLIFEKFIEIAMSFNVSS